MARVAKARAAAVGDSGFCFAKASSVSMKAGRAKLKSMADFNFAPCSQSI
jgi:hypothetical protein